MPGQSESTMRIVECSLSRHATAILDLFNEAILNTTALYDYQPRLPDTMSSWFRGKEAGRYPVVGAETASGELMGFASYDRFRPHPAYKYTVEHSVYVNVEHRRSGVATRLMQELINVARRQDYHVVVGGIDTHNVPSIALHEKLGFTYAGTIQHAGFKFGRWLDLAFYQIVLDTPANPVGG